MPWANYHTHSNLCDGATDLEELVKAAIEKRFVALGISSHSPVPFSSEWNMPFDKLLSYTNQMKRLKSKYQGEIELYTGMEVDFYPGLAGPHQFRVCTDYTLGSVHYLNQFSDNEVFNVDSSSAGFARGLTELYGSDPKLLVRDYYSKLCQMLGSDKPDVVGHFDVLVKFNADNKYFDEDSDWYKAEARAALEVLKQSKCIMEINTRKQYQRFADNFYPATWLLKEAKTLNIPVCLSSDAHAPAQLDAGLPEAAALLKDVGYKEIMILKTGVWQATAFNEDGICM